MLPIERQPLLLELFTSSVPLGRTHAGGPAPKGATTTANFRPVGAQTGALWGGRTWERLLNKKLARKNRKDKKIADSSLMVGGVVAGMELARKMRKRLGLDVKEDVISEGAVSRTLSTLGGQASAYSLDLPAFDHVSQYAEWRRECPNYHEVSHGAFCERCDEAAWLLPTGGAEWARKKGWAFQNPLQAYEGWDTIQDSLEPVTPKEVLRQIPDDPRD